MNDQIFYFFYGLANQSFFWDKVIVFFAVYFPYIVVVLAATLLIFYHKSWGEFTKVFLSGTVAWLASKILKYLIHTDRPFDILESVTSLFPETGFAFPSSHAAFFAALAMAIFFHHKKVGYFFLFSALLIGLARIAAGVHFPIDILGGFILGIIIAYFLRSK